jgi:hypothetical protein
MTIYKESIKFDRCTHLGIAYAIQANLVFTYSFTLKQIYIQYNERVRKNILYCNILLDRKLLNSKYHKRTKKNFQYPIGTAFINHIQTIWLMRH